MEMTHRFILICLLIVFPKVPLADVVKQSNSGICHDTSSPWYDRTKDFFAHDTMASCLAKGRAYSGYNGSVESRPADVPQEYDRNLYGGWIDADGDCQNLRHELLLSLSTGPVTLSSDGCRAAHGRWNDPYTGRIFTESRDMDLDHMVPLAWAHQRGADDWDAKAREHFANDPMNLFAVAASANRSKGARGPLKWLPPNESFHCQYVTRFHRIVLAYKLNYAPRERDLMDSLRAQLCQ